MGNLLFKIILFEDSIFILLKISYLGGLVNLYRPIIQISINENSKTYNGVLRNHQLVRVVYRNYKIKLHTIIEKPIKFTTEIELNFKNKNQELNTVKEFIKEKVS